LNFSPRRKPRPLSVDADGQRADSVLSARNLP